MKFKFGIEIEIPLLKLKPKLIFVDFSNTKFEELDKIIKKLPKYSKDYKNLRIGDLKIKEKRWYIEGFERFNLDGSFKECLIKGIEIRTNPYDNIDKTLRELKNNYSLLKKHLIRDNFYPTWISFNPFKSKFKPRLNKYGKKMRKESPESLTANIANLTYGPDLNFSVEGLNDEQLIQIGKKLTFYSPFMVPFSFSSPFKDGKLWKGYSYRTYLRTGIRPACMVFLNDKRNMIKSFPSLTQEARIEAERGRIEFKAIDTCNSLTMYKAYFILIKGLILDEFLKEKRLTPDKKLHKISALYGFTNDFIKKKCLKILDSIRECLDSKEADYIFYLKEIVIYNELPVLKLINDYKKTQLILKVLTKYENLKI